MLKTGAAHVRSTPMAQETRPKRLSKKGSAIREAQRTTVSLPEADTRVVVSVDGPDADSLLGALVYWVPLGTNRFGLGALT